MLATMLGYDALPENLRKQTGDMYINTNRPGLPSIKISDYAEKDKYNPNVNYFQAKKVQIIAKRTINNQKI